MSVILPGHLGQPSRPQLFFSSGERTRFRKVAESSVLARLAKSRCLGRFLGENGEFLTISCKKVTNGAIIQMYVNRLLLYSTLRLRPGVTTVTRAPLQSHDLVLNVRISIFEYICLLKSGDFGNFRKLENFEWEEIKIFRKAERPSLLFSSRALILSHVSPEPDLFLVWRHVQPDVQTKR